MRKMDSLLKATENFDQVDFDEKTFLEFMKRIAIWDYYRLSKTDYFALPESEKRVKISKYYLDMKSKGVGEFFLFNFLFGVMLGLGLGLWVGLCYVKLS